MAEPGVKTPTSWYYTSLSLNGSICKMRHPSFPCRFLGGIKKAVHALTWKICEKIPRSTGSLVMVFVFGKAVFGKDNIPVAGSLIGGEKLNDKET